MLELASLGAKVLQTRSVELAMRYKVRLRVLSSFEDTDDNSGTLVCDEEEIMESKVVSGVAYSRDEAKMTLVTVEDRPGIAAAIFGPLAEAGVNVDMIVQNICEKNYEGHSVAVTDMTFSCPTNQVARARQAMEAARAAGTIGYDDLVVDTDSAKVSVVGIGMRSHAGVAATHVQGTRRGGNQHQGHCNLRDQDFGADRPEILWNSPCRRCMMPSDWSARPEPCGARATVRGEPKRGAMPEQTESESRKLLRRLRDSLAGPGEGQERLDRITHLIADSMGTEVCSIYLFRDERHAGALRHRRARTPKRCTRPGCGWARGWSAAWR